MQRLIERYKKLYGDGEVRLEGQIMHVPTWLAALLIHRSGLRSRKKRHIRKRLKREIHRAVERGVEAMRDES